MKINRMKIEKETFWVNCIRCKKKITGVSEKQIKHNCKVHQMFCKIKKEEK